MGKMIYDDLSQSLEKGYEAGIACVLTVLSVDTQGVGPQSTHSTPCKSISFSVHSIDSGTNPRHSGTKSIDSSKQSINYGTHIYHFKLKHTGPGNNDRPP